MPYTCDLDASGWELYSYEGYEKLDESEAAAKAISAAMTEKVREAKAALKREPRLSKLKLAEHVRDEMYDVMGKFSGTGATDTEPQCALVYELEKALALDQYELER